MFGDTVAGAWPSCQSSRLISAGLHLKLSYNGRGMEQGGKFLRESAAMRSPGWTTLALSILVPALLDGHASLVWPVPRIAETSKTAPCGGLPRTDEPLVLETGQEIEVVWDEYVDHPGYFQLLFSSENDENFELLLDTIEHQPRKPGEANIYRATVRMPAVPCEKGTLQLIQYMTENPQIPRLYFSCADVRLVETTGPRFRRGDVNDDAVLDVADPVGALFHLFVDGRELACHDAADFDDNGDVEIADVVGLLGYLFLAQSPPRQPGPVCGTDRTADALECRTTADCE